MARDFGGQRLMVFPRGDLIVTFTGWEIVRDAAPTRDLVNRLLPAISSAKCPGTAH